MTRFGLYIVTSFCIYIFMFIIWVIIILICSWCCCCCCWSFCCCIMVTICFCSPDIGLWLKAGRKGKFVFNKGDTDVAKLVVEFATFGADRVCWSCLNQHSAPWWLLLLHVCVRKYFQTILFGCLRFLCCMISFLSIKNVVTCFACKSLYILLVYYIMDLPEIWFLTVRFVTLLAIITDYFRLTRILRLSLATGCIDAVNLHIWFLQYIHY